MVCRRVGETWSEVRRRRDGLSGQRGSDPHRPGLPAPLQARGHRGGGGPGDGGLWPALRHLQHGTGPGHGRAGPVRRHHDPQPDRAVCADQHPLPGEVYGGGAGGHVRPVGPARTGKGGSLRSGAGREYPGQLHL